MTEGQEHLETWDTLNNEFNKVQLLWRSQRELLEKLDELCMATQRMRWAQEGEEIDEMNHVRGRRRPSCSLPPRRRGSNIHGKRGTRAALCRH